MRFKNDKQRKAVMAKIKSLKDKRYFAMSFRQLKKKGILLNPDMDYDKDGIKNSKDCRPLDPKKQGIIHDIVSGVGKFGGYVSGEVKSGFKDMPSSYRRQKEKVEYAEQIKEAQREISAIDKSNQDKKKLEELKREIILKKGEAYKQNKKRKALSKLKKEVFG